MNKKSVEKIKGAMRDEITRSIKRLKAPGHPRPYFISYLLRDIDHFNVWARYGSLCQQKRETRRCCYADVRVGSYQYDHITKGGLSDAPDDNESFELTDMPIEDGGDALRFCLWRLTDARYREAVQAYHERKSRDVAYLDENKAFPSFERQKAVQSPYKLTHNKIDQADIEDLVRNASKVFKDFAEIKNSYVEFNGDFQTKIYVSSEGVERVWQEAVYSLTAYMWMQNKLSNHDLSLVINTADISELPNPQQFSAMIRTKIDHIYAIANGDRMTSYAGPVLLAPKPAGLFIHEVLGHRLEGCRLLSDEEGRTFRDKVGKRIVPKEVSIFDDPNVRKFAGRTLVGHYPFDDEGSVAQRATLVDSGVLKGFLTTRSPIRKKGHGNNGHARNSSYERPISRMANLIVEAKSEFSFEDLKQRLVEEVKSRRLPYGIILYDVEGGETGTEAYNFQAFLGEITRCVKIFPNGEERYVRGVDFVGTPLSSLSNIIAVGNDYEVDNSFCVAESGSVPVATVCSSLLLSNMELQAKDSTRLTQYALPLPWYDVPHQKLR